MARYARDQIEELIPAVLDVSLILDEQAEGAPDPDMPGAPYTDPHRCTDQWAEIADVTYVFDNSGLQIEEKQALAFRYGLNWSTADVHYATGWTSTEYRKLAEGAIEHMRVALNTRRSAR